jgi:microcystin degradation protein MlrC
MKKPTLRERKPTPEILSPSIKSINPENAFAAGDVTQCKGHYSWIGANASGRERRTAMDLTQPMIAQRQGSRMQKAKSPSPRQSIEAIPIGEF